MKDLTSNTFQIFTFKAIDEPILCEEYVKGHRKALTLYGITSVSSNNTVWMDYPYVYCTVIKNLKTNELVGGVRLQLSDGIHPLPLEVAIGYIDPLIHEKIRKYALRGPTAESCGLWVNANLKGIGISRLLMRASISTSTQLGLHKIVGVCGWHTLKLFSEIGFVIDTSLAENGDFIYPTQNHIANVIEISDPTMLQAASKNEQEVIRSLRENLTQTLLVDNNILVSYDLIYPSIEAGPFLKAINYDLNLIKILSNKSKGA